MRFAYVTSRMPRRRDFTGDLLDAEWLADSDHDVEVWIDEEGPGTDLLRSEGLSVTTSPQRFVELPGNGRLSADHVQARLVAAAHLRDPFEAVIYGPGSTVNLAWFEPNLGRLPKGVVLGGGILDHTNLVADDPRLAARYGRQVWASASFAASSNFLVSGIDPGDFGLSLPNLPIWNPVPELSSTEPPENPALVVVVATGEDRTGLASLLPRVLDATSTNANTSLVVVVPDLPIGPERAGDLVLAGCPADLRFATVIVSPGDDGVAQAFCSQADVVVAARPQDASVPAVGAVAAPVVFLHQNGHRVGSPFPPLREPDPPPNVLLVEADGNPGDLVTILQDDPSVDVFVLHNQAGGLDASRFLRFQSSMSFDVSVLGRPHPIFGTADLDWLSPDVLAVSREAVPSMIRWLDHAESLEELVGLIARTELAHRLRLLVWPGVDTTRYRRVADVDIPELPEWIGSHGVVPRINRTGAVADLESLRAGSRPKEMKVPDVRTWARKHRWADRVRLALPWKGGLLQRAMRGRW